MIDSGISDGISTLWIMTVFHLQEHPEAIDWVKSDPFFNSINEQCMKLYQPQRDVSIDEAMVKFQGRSSLKQYLPLKPVKRGRKVWVLADTNGYFWNMQVYTGKENSSEKGLGARVVEVLTSPLQHKYHHIYCDNFFTSVQLFEELEREGLYACGTARSDRTGFPSQLKKIKLTLTYSLNTAERLGEGLAFSS